ncbi:MAG: hypothetical protein AAF490_22795 [Chloroflexota bacterium]
MRQSRLSIQRPAAQFDILLLLMTVLVLASYAIFRYGGYWGETDTFAFANAIRAIQTSAELTPQGQSYPNGYGFQALSVFMMSFLGITLDQWLLVVGTFLVGWIVFPAWLLYRELTASPRGATLATVILFVQAEFLFPVLRGSHEKFTRGLMLFCLFLLVRSLKTRYEPKRFAGWLIAFYLAVFGLITFNSLLAISFIVATCLALGLNWTAMRFFNRKRTKKADPASQRLTYAALISMGMAFLFTFYIYQPAIHHLDLFQSIWDKVAALLLDVEESATDPYQVVSLGWINLPTYLTVSIGNWIILLVSAILWVSKTVQWLFTDEKPRKISEMILWAFYGAFAFIGALSVLIDFSGAIDGNLQVRSFPSFAMLAAPFIARWVMSRRATNWHRVTRLGWLAVMVLAVFATLKATNEPSLSNKWLFYFEPELQAIEFADATLEDTAVWTGYDERLVTAVGIREGLGNYDITLAHDVRQIEDTRNFLVTDITNQRGQRLARPLPVEVGGDSLITYDNGFAELYHLRPRTPYEP